MKFSLIDLIEHPNAPIVDISIPAIVFTVGLKSFNIPSDIPAMKTSLQLDSNCVNKDEFFSLLIK